MVGKRQWGLLSNAHSLLKTFPSDLENVATFRVRNVNSSIMYFQLKVDKALILHNRETFANIRNNPIGYMAAHISAGIWTEYEILI